MQENKKKTLAMLFILIVLFSMSAVTYAFFMSGVNSDNQEISIEAGTMKLTFSDADEGISKHLKFGESVTKLFTLENTGTLEATANIYWDNLVNTYLPGSLEYKLEYTTSESEEKVVAIESENVPRSEEPTQDILAYQQTVPSGVTYNYILTITLVHSDTVDQTRDLEAIFASGFTIQAVEKLDEPTLAAADTWYTQGGTTIARSSITSIDIVDSYDTTGKTIVDRWDASTEWDGSTTDDSGPVTAYLEDDGTGSTYKLTLAGNGYGKIYANADSSFVFYDSTQKTKFSALKTISGAEMLDMSTATTMFGMFAYCSLIETVNVSDWNISNVSSLRNLFFNCTSLTSVDVSNWNTSKVENMKGVFSGCSSLTTINVSKWNTSSATTLSSIFQSCSQLKTISLENWNVSNVENMSYVFTMCSKLESIDLTKWDTSLVTTFKAMFNDCQSLTTVGVSGLDKWDTSSSTDMSYMFRECHSLITLDVTKWDTSNVTTMHSMFQNCRTLKELDVTYWNVSNVNDMYLMFAAASDDETARMSLTTIGDVSNWDVHNVTTIAGMFQNCSSLKELDVSNWNTDKVENMSYTFVRCSSIKELDLSNFITTQVTNMTNMFFEMTGLEKVTLGANFSFTGNGSTSSVLPTPEGGYWYNSQGTAYLPEDVPSLTQDTYYAVKQA